MICIVDYGMGNLRSVQKALERIGYAATVSGDPEQIDRADKVILPGVGAYADAIATLRERGFVQPLLDAIRRGKPFLGICLGMQLLFERSHEAGEHQGLGVLGGEVLRFTDLPHDFKVPHMGWNQMALLRRPPAFKHVGPNDDFYFVHSYYVRPTDPRIVAGETDYCRPFCSAVWRDNVVATQFHPEKSQAAGMRLLQGFAEL